RFPCCSSGVEARGRGPAGLRGRRLGEEKHLGAPRFPARPARTGDRIRWWMAEDMAVEALSTGRQLPAAGPLKKTSRPAVFGARHGADAGVCRCLTPK